jgi:hypothetical protein
MGPGIRTVLGPTVKFGRTDNRACVLLRRVPVNVLVDGFCGICLTFSRKKLPFLLLLLTLRLTVRWLGHVV